ncbi:hypothetical protein ACFL6U_01730 [Planctomycetota bacterium]
MKDKPLDLLFDRGSAWLMGGTVIEDVWLFIRRPYVGLVRHRGWRHIPTIHQVVKRLDKQASSLYPQPTCMERAASGYWPGIVFAGPLVCVLVLSEMGVWFDWQSAEGVEPAVNHLAGILGVLTLVLVIVVGFLFAGLIRLVGAGHKDWGDTARALRSAIHMQGLTPGVAWVLGTILVNLVGYCFYSFMSHWIFQNYAFFGIVLSIISFVVLGFMVLSYFRSIPRIDPERQNNRALSLQLHADLWTLLVTLLVSEGESGDACVLIRTQTPFTRDSQYPSTVDGLLGGRNVSLVYMVAGAWLAHMTLQRQMTVEETSEALKTCIDNAGALSDLWQVFSVPGVVVLDSSSYVGTPSMFKEMDRDDSMFSVRRRDFMRFVLLHKAQSIQAYETQRPHPFPRGMQTYLQDTVDNDYLIYAFYEDTPCGLTDAQISAAKVNIGQLIDHWESQDRPARA